MAIYRDPPVLQLCLDNIRTSESSISFFKDRWSKDFIILVFTRICQHDGSGVVVVVEEEQNGGPWSLTGMRKLL